jgi:hypothetical protein
MSNSEEFKKTREALEKMVEAIQCLSEAMPRAGGHGQKRLDAGRLLNDARELLGLKKLTPGAPR